MDKVIIHVQLPDTEEGLAKLEDISFLAHSGQQIRESVHNEIEKFLVDKYKNQFTLEFDKEEIREAVKKRIINGLADKAIGDSL